MARQITTPPSKMERYMGFLVQEWARLDATPLRDRTAAPHRRTDVLDHTVAALADTPGLRLECGVWQGKSISRCATACPDHHWYGFDSFEGFPDDGRIDWQKPFKVIDLPDTPDNVTLIKGFFADTLGPFLATTPGPVAFVNIDCDIYSSTTDIFAALAQHGHLRPGLTLYFDELINYPDFMWNEALALFEMCESTGLGLSWISHDQHLRRPVDTAQHFHDGTHPTFMDDMHSGHWMQASCRLTAEPVDYGPMHSPAYRGLLRWMVAGMDKQQERRKAALADRELRLQEAEREREARYRARKALERERLAARKRQMQRAKRQVAG